MSWEKFTLYILYSTSILSWKVIIVQHVTRNVPLRYKCADLGLPCGLRGKCSSFTLCCSCSCFYCQVQPLDAALWQTLCLSYTRHLVIYTIRYSVLVCDLEYHKRVKNYLWMNKYKILVLILSCIQWNIRPRIIFAHFDLDVSGWIADLANSNVSN